MTTTAKTSLEPVYKAPPEDSFTGEYLLTEDLGEIAADIIEEYADDLGFIGNYSLSVVWKRKGGKKAGRQILGKCQAPSGLTKFYCEQDWIIWIAADYVRLGMTRKQVEALLFHELKHCAVDVETGAPTTVGHDVECFLQEVEEYGLWRGDLARAAGTFRQLRFDEARVSGVDPDTGEIDAKPASE